MSSQFEKVLLLDNRLKNTPNIRFGVVKGAQNVTSASYTANSASSSSAVWNVAVPSQSTIVSRHALLSGKLKVTFSGNVAKENLACAAFPLHQWQTTSSVTINSNQVTTNMSDVLELIIRSLPKEELQNFEGMCPLMADTYANNDAEGINSPFSGYNNTSASNYVHPNGAHPLVVDGAEVTFESTEPILISPFTFGKPNSSEGGFYGVTNLNFNLNLGNIQRVMKLKTGVEVVTNIEWLGLPSITFFFLTPSPSIAKSMDSRNVHPYYKFDRTISSGVSIPANESKTVVSNTVQLNSVPDKLFIFSKLKSPSCTTPDRHLAIENISINWNNQSGLLASASKAQLYQMSREAGIQQSWLEWSGVARNGAVDILTAGPILGLDFGYHIQLSDDYISANSLGNYNLQVNVTFKNYNTASSVNGNSYDLYVVAMTSGIISLDKGTCSVYTSLLSSEDVLKASDEAPMYKADVDRFVGGSIFDNIRSALPKILPVARQVLEMVPNQYAQAAASGLKTLGYAKMGMQNRVR